MTTSSIASVALLAGLLSTSLMTGCTTSDPMSGEIDELGDETAADGEAGKGDGAAFFTYYSVVPDSRQCSLDAGPDCGVGYFASRVNRSVTSCGAGVSDAKCKIASIDLAPTGISAVSGAAYIKELAGGSQFLMRGTIAVDASGTGRTLVVSELWWSSSSAWVGAEQGVFTMVKGNGLACIESPCADKTEWRLNSNVDGVQISWLDLEPVGETNDWIDTALDEIEQEGLILVGTRFYAEGAKGRSANAIFSRAWE